MALTYSEAKELCKISKKSGTILLVGHVLRYDYKVEFLKRMLEKNELGKIKFVKTARTSFKRFRPCCGEIFNDAIHDIDMCCWLLGKYPEKVQAINQYFQREGFEDLSIINLDFGSNQLVNIHVNNLAANRERSLFIVGEKKSVYIDFTKNNFQLFDTENASLIGKRFFATDVTTVEKEEDMYAKEVDHFAECILENATPRITPIEAAKAVRVAEKAIEAGKKKKWIGISY